jgi:hypothetical protein
MLLRGCVLRLTAVFAGRTGICGLILNSPAPLVTRTCPLRLKRATSWNTSPQLNSEQRLTKVSNAMSGEPRTCSRIRSVRGSRCAIGIPPLRNLSTTCPLGLTLSLLAAPYLLRSSLITHEHCENIIEILFEFYAFEWTGVWSKLVTFEELMKQGA